MIGLENIHFDMNVETTGISTAHMPLCVETFNLQWHIFTNESFSGITFSLALSCCCWRVVVLNKAQKTLTKGKLAIRFVHCINACLLLC